MTDSDKTLRRGEPSPPERARAFGKFNLVEVLGRGGWGEVWKAWEPGLGRHVALKLLHGAIEPEDRQRFLREAHISGCLSHPAIVPVFEQGRIDATDYIAMGLVDGQPLSKLRFEPREAVRIVRDAARAVHVAHDVGVIHRDLKPANLMIETKTGSVFVLDFGLARQLDAPAGVTIPGTILGTPSYMPPEQASGDLDQLGPAADIYSLGATLYELCTGRVPYEGAGIAEILTRILSEDPPRPRHRNPRLPRDIEAVILKAIARHPEDRYSSAAAFADDLDCYLEGRPITARPETARDRLRRALDRNPRLVGMIAALLLIAVGIGVVMTGLAIQNLQLEAESTRIEAKASDRRLAVINRDLQRRRAADLLRPAIDTLDLWEFRRAFITPTDRAATLDAIRAAFNAVPDFGSAWIEQGRLAWADDDFEAAHRAFTEAIDDSETAPTAYYYRARFALDRSSKTTPHPLRFNDNSVMFVVREQSKTDKGVPWREAARKDLDLFERMASPERFGPHLTFARALEQYVKASDDAALRDVANLLRPALESRRIPAVEVNLLLANCCLYSGDYASALAAIDAIIDDGIVDAQILDRRAIILGARASARRAEGLVIEPLLREAAAAFHRARDFAPDEPLLAVSESRILLTIADLKSRANVDAVPVIEEALAVLDPIVTGGSFSGPALTTRAQALRMRGTLRMAAAADPLPDFASAEADLNRALELDPKDFAALNGLGGLCLLRSVYHRNVGVDPTADLLRACDCFTRVLNIPLKLPFVLFNRSSVYLTLATDKIFAGLDPAEDLSAAEKDIAEAIVLNPRYGEPYINRGRIHAIRGEWLAAYDAYRKALELDPTLALTVEPALKDCESHLDRDF